MSRFNKILYSTVAVSLAWGSAAALAETRESFGKPKNKKPYISRSGQIGGGSGFSFFGNSWGSNWNRNSQRQSDEFRVRRPAPEPPVKIYTYKPDALFVLADRKAKQPKQPRPVFSAADAPASYNPTPAELRGTKLDDSLAQTIFELVRAGDTHIQVTKAQRRAIADFYRERGYKALWTSMDGLEDHAHQLMATLRDADAEGLSAADYKITELTRNAGDIDAIEADLTAIARIDIQLTALAVRYAQHASGGRIVASRLSAYHDPRPQRVAARTALARMADTDQPVEYLKSLHPRHPAYAGLKAALKEVRTAVETVEVIEPIPAGPTIVPGRYDGRIPSIRKRLIKDGHLEAASSGASDDDVEIIPSSGEELPGAQQAMIEGSLDNNLDSGETPADDLYDGELVQAVKDFQRSAGLTPDGLIGRRTIKAFNGNTEVAFDKAGRIIANMERLRWLPRHLGSSHVFVNQAAYKLQVVRNGATVWRTKVIVGKPSHQTSIFSDEMETVVLNPYWGVPQSIITQEMLPKLINDPGYLDRQGYEVFNGSGRKVSSYNVDWWNYYDKVPFAVRQPPGRKNALGQIKFLFPNKHAIYLHDTPTKKLFNLSQRAFSHGCVRVQNPRMLAEKVLGWDQNTIASRISTGKNQKISLKRKLPVHLAYFTAWPGTASSVDYFKDIYGRDKRLEQAFAATSATFR